MFENQSDNCAGLALALASALGTNVASLFKQRRAGPRQAGQPTVEGKPTGVFATRQRMRQADKQLAAQAEASYKRSVADWKAASPPKKAKAGATVTPRRA